MANEKTQEKTGNETGKAPAPFRISGSAGISGNHGSALPGLRTVNPDLLTVLYVLYIDINLVKGNFDI